MKVTEGQKELVKAADEILSQASEKPELLAELSASEIARRLGVSTANLSRAYSACHPYPLQKNIQMKRFFCFQHIVWCKPEITLKEALEQLDVRSPSHFIKAYKDFFHQTPGEYIREIREEKQNDSLPYCKYCPE